MKPIFPKFILYTLLFVIVVNLTQHETPEHIEIRNFDGLMKSFLASSTRGALAASTATLSARPTPQDFSGIS